ncbi:hypothetical protein B0H16DRAFT_1644329 [Mycena metata]|uniref:Uncharacterized protein n=1 Tax=Mycena metata TaxID=1033252 RepID=A0AAD7GN64_9AGAR|nr:hypothetical protein B0H16DRAFT_1644329 [Mycena metata]
MRARTRGGWWWKMWKWRRRRSTTGTRCAGTCGGGWSHPKYTPPPRGAPLRVPALPPPTHQCPHPRPHPPPTKFPTLPAERSPSVSLPSSSSFPSTFVFSNKVGGEGDADARYRAHTPLPTGHTTLTNTAALARRWNTCSRPIPPTVTPPSYTLPAMPTGVRTRAV